MVPRISDFFDAVEDIDNKNSGGCLFFCYAFWLFLKKHGLPTESFNIIQYAYGENDSMLERNMNWLECPDSNTPGEGVHFTWVYEGEEYDGEGPVDRTRWDHHREVLDGLNGKFVCLVDEFCKEALENGSWNFWFDFHEAAEIVEDRLEIEMPIDLALCEA